MRRWAMIASAGLILAAGSVRAYEPAIAVPAEVPGASAEQKGFPASVLPKGGKGDTCAQFQAVAGFSNYAGKVSDSWISTINGSVDVTINIGHGLAFEQIVQTSNPLYHTVQQLKTGQTVRMSGRFTHGNGECGYKLLKIGVALTSIKVVN
jgi:hypothetical protein